ncbi:MAG: cell division protein FtsL [Bacillota bacterium]|nr:cell division protein FtsL [Bacillota bacterium]
MPSVRTQKQEKSRVQATFTAISVVLAAIMIVAGLAMRAEIARQNDVNVELSAYVSELKEENIRLKIETATAYELGELEEAAKNELGMLPPGNEQLVGIDVKTDDNAVILGNGEEQDSIIDNWISSLRNIFSAEK